VKQGLAGDRYAFLATALGTIRHHGVDAPPPATIEGLLYALPEATILCRQRWDRVRQGRPAELPSLSVQRSDHRQRGRTERNQGPARRGFPGTWQTLQRGANLQERGETVKWQRLDVDVLPGLP
jgi:hypothetical protein